MSSERHRSDARPLPDDAELTWAGAAAVLVLAAVAGAAIGSLAWVLTRRGRR